ncbi:MAG: hypothetical protein PWQ70_3007 [Clostridiales bacterium]|jgi:aromatic ring hydroxylase|nr:hypothetical protein [Clostridiales bacterium]MDK2907278.1 hypothetical protein [Petrotoga sp.]
MSTYSYPKKIQEALQKKGFYDLTREQRVKKHIACTKKIYDLLSPEEKEDLVKILEESRWPS